MRRSSNNLRGERSWVKFPTIWWIVAGLEYTQGENESCFFSFLCINARLSFVASHSHQNLPTDSEITLYTCSIHRLVKLTTVIIFIYFSPPNLTLVDYVCRSRYIALSFCAPLYTRHMSKSDIEMTVISCSILCSTNGEWEDAITCFFCLFFFV